MIHVPPGEKISAKAIGKTKNVEHVYILQHFRKCYC